MITYGRILPTTSSMFLIGETMSCSSVSRSRSRAMVMVVSMTMVMVRMTSMRLGTMYTVVRRSGLYQVFGSSSIGWSRTGFMRASCAIMSFFERVVMSDVVVLVAFVTVCGSESSTTSWTFVGLPVFTSDAYRVGTTSVTFARLD